MDISALHLDWIALALGTVGTVLWAHAGKQARWAAVWWLASSVVWIAYAYAMGLPALGLRDCLSVVLYLYGAWRWLMARRHDDSSASAPASNEMLQ